jgi:hypothetical protein
LIYSKSLLIKLVLPSGGYEPGNRLTLRNLGLRNFSLFSLILILFHHTALFCLDAWDSSLLGLGLRKAVSSTVLTYAAILIVQSFSLMTRRK